MKLEDVLQELLGKLKDQNDKIQKELTQVESKLEIHLETSIYRVEGYDKFNESVKLSMQELRKDVDFCLTYIKDQESKKKGVEESKKKVSDFANVIKWIVGFIIALFALKPIVESLAKLFGSK